jgi:putative transcriptional regulator
VRPYLARLLVAIGVLVVARTAWGALPATTRPVAGLTGRPAKGKLLIATRQIGDPNFSKSVILLVAFEDGGGGMGVIVNRPTPIPLAKILPQFAALAGRGDRVWMGGPVLPTSLLVLHSSSKPGGNAEAVFGDVYVLTSRDAVEGLLGSKNRAGRFRAYAGHAGWGPGQLENEIARGDWLVVPARPEVVFSEAPGDLWEQLMERSEGEWTLLRPPAPAGLSRRPAW